MKNRVNGDRLMPEDVKKHYRKCRKKAKNMANQKKVEIEQSGNDKILSYKAS